MQRARGTGTATFADIERLPEDRAVEITGYRWEAGGYLVALTAATGQIVRAEPFDSAELDLSLIFGDEDSHE